MPTTAHHPPTTRFAQSGLGRLSRWLILPVLLSGALYATWAGFALYHLRPEVSALLAVVLFGFFGISVLERLLPYRAEWLHSRGDLHVDLLNLVISSGVVNKALDALVALYLVSLPVSLALWLGFDPWPRHWSLWGQLALVAVLSEFGSYWYHYFAHKTPWMWRFHAVHHSPHRLYLWNGPRFHPVDRVISSLADMWPFIVFGGSPELVALYFTYNAITGFLQHCNIDLKLGVLHYVFSAGELHRWHHSKLVTESDNNYGSNLIIWDLAFGTFFRPKNREVGEIGLLNPDYPTSYLGQLAAPFHTQDLSKPAGYVSQESQA